jgi:hypothetical protein
VTSLQHTIFGLFILAFVLIVFLRLMAAPQEPVPVQPTPPETLSAASWKTPPPVAVRDALAPPVASSRRLTGVVATVYHAVASQTDDTPFTTADGTRVDPAKVASGEQRIAAVSRDLLSRWGGPLHYGDRIIVKGAGDLDGAWFVHDTMNRRYGKTAPSFDHGVRGVVSPHPLPTYEVDGFHHLDLLVPSNRLGKWLGVEVVLP